MFDGKAFGEQMVEVVKSYVDQATAPLLEKIAALEAKAPIAGEPGRDADPVTDEQIAAAVTAYFDANPVPTPENGKDGQDGKSVEPEAVANMVAETVERAVAAIPVPRDGRDGSDGKDGVGLAGAIIDRAGELVVTLTNGEAKSLGPILGRDGADGKDGERGGDGFSLEDFDVNLKADGRTVELTFARGDLSFIRELALPTMIYRGAYAEGKEYEKGDTVTWAGSLWHCNGGEKSGEWSGTTSEKPGDGSKAWTLAAKRGRDGKDFTGSVLKAPEKVRI